MLEIGYKSGDESYARFDKEVSAPLLTKTLPPLDDRTKRNLERLCVMDMALWAKDRNMRNNPRSECLTAAMAFPELGLKEKLCASTGLRDHRVSHTTSQGKVIHKCDMHDEHGKLYPEYKDCSKGNAGKHLPKCINACKGNPNQPWC